MEIMGTSPRAMNISEELSGSCATPSTSGQLIACIANGKLRIHYSQALERCIDLKIRIQPKDVTAIKWSDDSSLVAITSPQLIEVLDLEDDAHIRLDNGSGGLGRFASADFVGDNHLIVLWEFGRAKLWCLSDGKGTDLGDLKTKCEGRNWAARPNAGKATQMLALLSRVAAQDQLVLHFPTDERSILPQTLSTIDARGLTWSPDGRWLAALDTAHANPSLFVFTPDGHQYRTHPAMQAKEDDFDLGIKAIAWSPDSRSVAISRYDNIVTLLNTRTFTPTATIEHSTTIAEPAKPGAAICAWREAVSASNLRSYSPASLPVSPPLSRTRTSSEPSEIGIAEVIFSADGLHLATRDQRMLSTVWIWDVSSLRAKAVLLQHSNVRRLHWHSTQKQLLMLDCGESIAYLYDAASDQPPIPIQLTVSAIPVLSFLPCPLSMGEAEFAPKPTILATTKTTICLVHPEGRSPQSDTGTTEHVAFDEGESEDSLIEVLTGKKPAPPRTEPSYTEMVDIAADTEEDTVGLDDTFREKRKAETPNAHNPDPLDDSEIF